MRRPRDKAKAEGGVLLVERWILAVLRNRTFFSLDRLRHAAYRLVLEGKSYRALRSDSQTHKSTSGKEPENAK